MVNGHYGNWKRVERARGRGPFMMKDSPDHVENLFGRLGYIADRLDSDVGEAIDTFTRFTYNRREMRTQHYRIERSDSVKAKMDMMI